MVRRSGPAALGEANRQGVGGAWAAERRARARTGLPLRDRDRAAVERRTAPAGEQGPQLRYMRGGIGAGEGPEGRARWLGAWWTLLPIS